MLKSHLFVNFIMPRFLSDPHLIIYNARIFRRPTSDAAITVLDNKIAAIGADEEILPLSTPQTEKINAQGRWILPALMDSHAHLTEYAARKLQVELSGCQSLDEALHAIRARVETSPEGSWVTGGGWDKNNWGLSDFPHRQLLDAISTRHFIALNSKDWHSLWVNTAVLEKYGIKRSISDPKGGRILRDEQGELNGIFQESARQMIFDHIPPPSFAELKPVLLETFSEFHRFGITAVHSVETASELSHYQHLHSEEALGLRIFFYLPLNVLPAMQELNIHSGFGNPSLKICGIKMFADGALGAQTAEMLENYQGLDHAGVGVLAEDELLELVSRCVSQKLSCAIHAIGDKANRKVLKSFGALHRQSREAGLRHRIEHCQLLHPDDIPLFHKYDVTASMQPIHLSADIPMIKKYWGERGRYAYALGSIASAGGRLIFGSDTPIESFNPWKGIFIALERKYLADPQQASFYPEEEISIERAIDAYTINSAWAVEEEMNLGTIDVGKQADLIMIDRDIFSEPPESLLDTKVLLTVMAGKVVHRQDE